MGNCPESFREIRRLVCVGRAALVLLQGVRQLFTDRAIYTIAKFKLHRLIS